MKEWMGHWYNKYAVIASVSAIVLAAYEGIPWCRLSPSDWGTWFGAIGTVAAFLGAIGVAYWTWNKGQIAKLDDREVVAQAILAIAYDFRYRLAAELRRIHRPLRSNNLAEPTDWSNLFEKHLGVLEQIPLHQQPTPEHVYGLMQMKQSIASSREVFSFVTDIFSRWDEQGQSYEFAELKMKEFLDLADSMVEDASRMVRLLGRVPHPEPDYLRQMRNFRGFQPWR